MRTKRLFLLSPLAGALIFAILYFIAAALYPGGSQFDHHSIGFSWKGNYWCNLLSENAINGRHNDARAVAIVAMAILCITLSLFWIIAAQHLVRSATFRIATQVSGLLSMVFASFLFIGKYHDVFTNFASAFGILASTAIFMGLLSAKWYWLVVLGLLNVCLIGLNNYLYYNRSVIVYLPIVQKITFVTFLLWICLITLRIRRAT